MQLDDVLYISRRFHARIGEVFRAPVQANGPEAARPVGNLPRRWRFGLGISPSLTLSELTLPGITSGWAGCLAGIGSALNLWGWNRIREFDGAFTDDEF